MILGWIIWYFFLKSGIHPTIAGVLIAFTIPINRKIRINTFRNRIDCNLQQFYTEDTDDKKTLNHHQLDAIDNMETEITKVQSPLQSLEHTLHGFVTYLVMPIFALANAGVAFSGSFADIFSALSLQIEVSLVLGKVVGIFLFSYLSVKLGIAVLPVNTKWINIIGLGLLGGMGFTMSLFIANLAFTSPEHLDPAKIGILIGSFIAGVVGFFILRASLKPEE
jgi:NhaA family Na+:H+ antiporter